MKIQNWSSFHVLAAVSISALTFLGCHSKTPESAPAVKTAQTTENNDPPPPPTPENRCNYAEHTVPFGTSTGIEVTDLSAVPFERFVFAGVNYSALFTQNETGASSLIEVSSPDLDNAVTECYGATDQSLAVVNASENTVATIFKKSKKRAFDKAVRFESLSHLSLQLSADGNTAKLSIEPAVVTQKQGTEIALLLKQTGAWDALKVFAISEKTYEIQLEKTTTHESSIENTIVRLTFSVQE